MTARRYLPLLAGFLWGTTFPAIEVALESFAPTQIALVRTVLGSAVFGAMLVTLGYGGRLRVSRGDVVPLALLSFFGIGLFYLTLVFSVDFSTPVNSSFLTVTFPLFVSVLGPFVLEERLDRDDVVGLASALAGAYLIIGNGRLLPLFSSRTFLGDAIALLGALSFTTYLLAHRKFSNRMDLDQMTLTFYMLSFSIPVLAAPVVYLRRFEVGPIEPSALAALLWISIAVTAVAYLVLNLSLEVETTTLTALRLLFIPLISTLISVAFLDEKLTAVKVAGGLAIAIGIAYPPVASRMWGDGVPPG